jgi:hypothetical protein
VAVAAAVAAVADTVAAAAVADTAAVAAVGVAINPSRNGAREEATTVASFFFDPRIVPPVFLVTLASHPDGFRSSQRPKQDDVCD